MFKGREGIVSAISSLFIQKSKVLPGVFSILSSCLIGQSWANSSYKKATVNNYLSFLAPVMENTSYIIKEKGVEKSIELSNW